MSDEHIDRIAGNVLAEHALKSVLKEFVTDVQAVGFDSVAEDWPDLAITYKRAVAVITKLEGRQ